MTVVLQSFPGIGYLAACRAPVLKLVAAGVADFSVHLMEAGQIDHVPVAEIAGWRFIYGIKCSRLEDADKLAMGFLVTRSLGAAMGRYWYAA